MLRNTIALLLAVSFCEQALPQTRDPVVRLPVPTNGKLTLVGPTTRTAVIGVGDWQQNKWYDWGGHRIFHRFAKMITGQNVAIVEAGQLDRDRYDVRIWIGR